MLPRATTLVALAIVLGASPGCRSRDAILSDDAVVPEAAVERGIVSVLSEDGTVVALGVVVRCTFDTAVAIAAPGRDVDARHLRVLVAGAPTAEPASSIGEGLPLVLSFPRAGRDLRPYEVAADPPASGETVALRLPPLDPEGPAAGASVASLVAEGPPGRIALAAVPRTDPSDLRTAAHRALAARGGLVLDPRGRLAGFVVASQDERCLALPAPTALAQALPRVVVPEGADLVRPDDGFLLFRARVLSARGVPPLAARGDSLDVVLTARAGGRDAGSISLSPVASSTLLSRVAGPAELSLVARSSSLLRGEEREPLTIPARTATLAGRHALTLELLPGVLERLGPEAPLATRVVVEIEAVDPDRSAGPSRSVAGARPLAVGRIGEGRVDLSRGEATDFFALDAADAGEVAAFLYRRRAEGRVAVRVFSAGFERVDLAIDAGPADPHLAASTGRLLRGRAIVRVRQVAGEEPVPYELFLAPRSDAAAVVGGLFRLIAREAAREGAGFLDTDAFADEAAEALAAVQLDEATVARALVAELEGRVAAGRRAAFRLLERRLASAEALSALEGALARRATAWREAGVVLARGLRKNPKLRDALLATAAASGEDPWVVARAVGAAVRSGDAALARALADSCEGNDSPVVLRAVAAARAMPEATEPPRAPR